MNREVPHLLVLPEDHANAQLVNGFILHPIVDHRRIKVMKEAGGWREVIHQFETIFIRDLQMYPDAFLVLLFDLDEKENRLEETFKKIPSELKDRVFVLGAWNEPEDLKKEFRISSFEKIGEALAGDCQGEMASRWDHKVLKHNSDEVKRLHQIVTKFLFRRV